MTEKSDHDHDDPATNQLVRRGFDGVAMAHENAATQALVAKSIADVQSRWVMAMKNPRQAPAVRQAILHECRRPGFARVAVYAVPRGGGMIRGLSIRFAEVAMRCMSNMSCEAMTLYDSDEERVVRVTATDFETNATWSRDITIKKTIERKQLRNGQRALRERTNSYGDRIFIVEATDDDVRTKEAAEISKAARTAILRLIPGHLQDEAKAVIQQVAENAAATDPESEKNKIFDEFAKLNVMPNDLAEWLGSELSKITPPQIVELQMLYRAIRDGEMNWTEALEHAAVLRERAKKVGAQAAKSVAVADGKAPAAPSPSGKGATAVKDKIREAKASDKAEPAPDAGPKCTKCGVPIESNEPGAQCYACSQS